MRAELSTEGGILQVLLEGELSVSEMSLTGRQRGLRSFATSTLRRRLPAMEESGWVQSHLALRGGRRKRLYSLTPAGRGLAESERARNLEIYGGSRGRGDLEQALDALMDRIETLETRPAPLPPVADGFTVRAPALEGDRGFSLDELLFECGPGSREAALLAELEGASLIVKVEARDASGQPIQLVLIKKESGGALSSDLEKSLSSMRYRALFGDLGDRILDPGG